jgi:hypothetical protein
LVKELGSLVVVVKEPGRLVVVKESGRLVVVVKEPGRLVVTMVPLESGQAHHPRIV